MLVTPSIDRIVPALRIIPAGRFVMGESEADRFANDTERPRHEVVFAAPFALAAFPVTVGEFRQFVPDFAPAESAELPVTSINWHEANGYCAWLAEETGRLWRLPSEAEWEYACRAGTDTTFYTGIDIDVADATYLYSEHAERIGIGHPTAQGLHRQNAFGLEDMHGNVNEWCADLWHPTYAAAPADGSAWIENGRPGWRVIRGGAWDYLPRLLRSSWRDALPKETRRDNVGFRIACSEP